MVDGRIVGHIGREDYTKVCSWCGHVIHRGRSPKVSHGMCKPCAGQWVVDNDMDDTKSTGA